MVETVLPRPTEGSRMLGEVVKALGTQALVARELGISSSSLLCRYISGSRKPGRNMADRIRERFGIPVSVWDVPLAQSDSAAA